MKELIRRIQREWRAAKDAAQALAWYKKAAEAGHDRARKAVERMEKLV